MSEVNTQAYVIDDGKITQIIKLPWRTTWRKMTPGEYGEKCHTFGKHTAVSQEVVEGCQEIWVFLGDNIKFVERL